MAALFSTQKAPDPSKSRSSWTGAAFLVESMLLLVFLIGSFAVFTQMFAKAIEQADESRAITVAVAAASNSAEQFAADPASADGTSQTVVDGMVVQRQVTVQKRDHGTFYTADIMVYKDASSFTNGTAEPLYTIRTARYVSGVS